MTTRLQKHGDGWALILDQATLDRMKITIDTPLQLAASDGQLVVEPAFEPDAPDKEFEDVLKEVNTEYAEVFRRLAE